MQNYSEYDEYWDRRGAVPRFLYRWEIGARRIEDGATVLDVGCGSGNFLQHLHTVKPNTASRGVDISTSAVELTRAAGFEAQVHDVSTDDIDGVFDYVTCFDVIEHIADAEAVLHRLMAATRRELIISVPNVGFIVNRARLLLFGRSPLTNCVFHIKEHLRFWGVRDFREWVAAQGYQVVYYEAQYGPWRLWRWWPSMFGKGIVYVVARPE